MWRLGSQIAIQFKKYQRGIDLLNLEDLRQRIVLSHHIDWLSVKTLTQ